MYMRLAMNRDDLTALNYLQYFVQENILNDSPVTEVSETSREELKKAVTIVDSIVCIGVNLQESDCEIRLEVDETKEKQIGFEPFRPWTYTEIPLRPEEIYTLRKLMNEIEILKKIYIDTGAVASKTSLVSETGDNFAEKISVPYEPWKKEDIERCFRKLKKSTDTKMKEQGPKASPHSLGGFDYKKYLFPQEVIEAEVVKGNVKVGDLMYSAPQLEKHNGNTVTVASYDNTICFFDKNNLLIVELDKHI